MTKLKNSKLRYIEISLRNPVTRLMLGSGSSCDPIPTCDDVCIEIRRAGKKDCGRDYDPCTCHDTWDCCKPCDPCEQVATVCALEIDEEGYTVFEWPTFLLDFKEGWYEGYVMSNCQCCGVLPIRIGPRCNVLEVEHVVVGPDSACVVGCEDDCVDQICPPKYKRREVDEKPHYTPEYEVC